MTINVNVITETSYTIDIPDVPPEEKDVYYDTTEGETDSRIEMWR